MRVIFSFVGKLNGGHSLVQHGSDHSVSVSVRFIHQCVQIRQEGVANVQNITRHSSKLRSPGHGILPLSNITKTHKITFHTAEENLNGFSCKPPSFHVHARIVILFIVIYKKK